MNEKITLPGLIQLLALQSGDTKKQSEDFIKELFGVIGSALEEGDVVKIKSLGVFKTISVEARKSVNVSTGEDHQIPAHRKVVFSASKELAAMVNEPFEMFETVELEDDVTFDDNDEDGMLSGDVVYETDDIPADDIPGESDGVYVVGEAAAVQADGSERESECRDEDPAAEDNDSLQIETVEQVESEPGLSEAGSELPYPSEPECESEDGDEDYNVYTVEDVEDELCDSVEPEGNAFSVSGESRPEELADVVAESESDGGSDVQCADVSGKEERDGKRSRGRFCIGFISGFIVAALIGCALSVWFIGFEGLTVSCTRNTEKKMPPVDYADNDSVVESGSRVEAETAEIKTGSLAGEADGVEIEDAAPTTPSDEKVYDTITTTRYLTTMAKDHYGNYNLWPVIYEENKEFLGHPDRIRPGTKVVVPPLSKYGVDPDNPDDVAKAKRKGVEIYSRYK